MSQAPGQGASPNPAETYERHFVPALFAPMTSLLVEAAALRPVERVLDLACGTGVVARRVAPLVSTSGQVTGFDLNPAMLAVAEAAAAADGLSIAWCQGTVEVLPFQGATFDLVLCQHGLQFVPDRARALREMRRVLVPGGRLVVAVWQGLDRHPGFAALHEIIQRHLGGPGLGGPFALGNADELRGLLDQAGFADVAIDTGSFTARFPVPEQFVALQISAAAAAIPSITHLDADSRQRLTERVAAEFAEPMRAWVVD